MPEICGSGGAGAEVVGEEEAVSLLAGVGGTTSVCSVLPFPPLPFFFGLQNAVVVTARQAKMITVNR